MRRALLTIVFTFAAAAARAQSPYVAGTIGADVSRLSHSESNVSSEGSGGSEVVSGSLRVGTAVGQNWGVELEFVRSGESRGAIPIAVPVFGTATLGVATPTAAVANLATPVRGFETDVRSSHSDLDAAAWVRQRAGSVDLVYLGG